jgi:hypothetical protein
MKLAPLSILAKECSCKSILLHSRILTITHYVRHHAQHYIQLYIPHYMVSPWASLFILTRHRLLLEPNGPNHSIRVTKLVHSTQALPSTILHFTTLKGQGHSKGQYHLPHHISKGQGHSQRTKTSSHISFRKLLKQLPKLGCFPSTFPISLVTMVRKYFLSIVNSMVANVGPNIGFNILK